MLDSSKATWSKTRRPRLQMQRGRRELRRLRRHHLPVLSVLRLSARRIPVHQAALPSVALPLLLHHPGSRQLETHRHQSHDRPALRPALPERRHHPDLDSERLLQSQMLASLRINRRPTCPCLREVVLPAQQLLARLHHRGRRRHLSKTMLVHRSLRQEGLMYLHLSRASVSLPDHLLRLHVQVVLHRLLQGILLTRSRMLQL
jgi:hypothetical protein